MYSRGCGGGGGGGGKRDKARVTTLLGENSPGMLDNNFTSKVYLIHTCVCVLCECMLCVYICLYVCNLCMYI